MTNSRPQAREKRSRVMLVKMFVVGASLLFTGGLFLTNAPEDLKAEVPWWREFFIGLSALGGLLILAALIPRLHSLLICLTCAAVAAGCAWVLYTGIEMELWQKGLTAVFGVFMAISSIMALASVFTGRNTLFRHLKNNDYIDSDDFEL